MIAGVVAAEIFIAGVIVFGIVTGNSVSLFGIILIVWWGQFFGAFVSGIIALFCGAVSGIGFFLLQNHLSLVRGVLLGTTLAALLLVLIVGGVLRPHYSASTRLEDWVPIFVLFIAAGAWGGRKLARGVIGHDLPS